MTVILKIGILGTRGIPNAYGGFEQFAEYLSSGLAKKGHEIWVYNSNRHPYQFSEWNGVNIIHCKDLENKIGTAGQFIYDYNCLRDAKKRNLDILLQLGYTSNSIWYFKWPKTPINIVNMDGLEWKRSKYGNLTRMFLKFAESLAAKHADILIADSLGIKEHLKSRYNKQSIFIPYGATVIDSAENSILESYDLKSKQYYLLIARMEPENNIEMIIEGYLKSHKKYPLVIVSNPNNKFGRFIRKKYKDDNIKYPGAIYHQETINALRYYSKLYFHGHSVGGTNPSLLEAMACSCTIAAHNNIFNKAILTDSALYFSGEKEVSKILNGECGSFTELQWKDKNIAKIRRLYNWDKVINDYEEVFLTSYQKLKTSSDNMK